MKTIFMVFVIAFLAVASYSQKKQTDLEFERLKGKVKSVQGSAMYLGTKDDPNKSPERDYYNIEIYGLDGNIAEEQDNRHGIKQIYQFVDGYLSMKEVVVDKKKAANIMRDRAIGNAGLMEDPLKTLKSDERFLTRFDDEYDESGRRKLRRIFLSDGKMDSISLYSYNSSGQFEKEIYNSYGNKWTYFYSYDANGNLKEKVMKRSKVDGEIDMTNRTEYSGYKFDAKGNWIERKYIHYGEYEDSLEASEGIDYRDIKYHDEAMPKKLTKDKIKKKG